MSSRIISHFLILEKRRAPSFPPPPWDASVVIAAIRCLPVPSRPEECQDSRPVFVRIGPLGSAQFGPRTDYESIGRVFESPWTTTESQMSFSGTLNGLPLGAHRLPGASCACSREKILKTLFFQWIMGATPAGRTENNRQGPAHPIAHSFLLEVYDLLSDLLPRYYGSQTHLESPNNSPCSEL